MAIAMPDLWLVSPLQSTAPLFFGR